MPRIPTMSRAALLKLQTKSPPEKSEPGANKADASKKKSKKKATSKR
jgi:hypothetical protein